MAIVFELYVETLTEDQMCEMVSFWDGYSTTLRSGCTFKWNQSNEAPTRLSLWSRELTTYGVQSYDHAIQVSECGIDLAMRLVDAPDFYLARIGIEVGIMAKEDYLADFSEEGKFVTPPGMVLCRDLWEQLGKPRLLTRFRDGYYWNSYTGENANPVFLDRELNRLWEKLPGGTDYT